jgi:hypothetical protein
LESPVPEAEAPVARSNARAKANVPGTHESWNIAAKYSRERRARAVVRACKRANAAMLTRERRRSRGARNSGISFALQTIP